MEPTVTIRQFDESDLDALNGLIMTNDWPFHNNKITEPKTIEYFTDSTKTLLAVRQNETLGYVRIEEFIDGDSPLFDIRIKATERGNGLGIALIKAAETAVFTELPHTVRFEGTTRIDNLPMLSLFEKMAWCRESHYRKGWKLAEGEYIDAIGFSILRDEWERSR